MSRGKPCFISIHAPRTGSDPCSGVDIWLREISIHAPRTGSDDFLKCRVVVEVVISIHAPRTGSDVREADVDGQLLDFNPRSPHGERQLFRPFLHAFCLFQSTLPARGATVPNTFTTRVVHDFNPRSPHGERPVLPQRRICLKAFQSTLPARGATEERVRRHNHLYFNPRSPHGERPVSKCQMLINPLISIHAPRTGSDKRAIFKRRALSISIHAPRTGSDNPNNQRALHPCNFNPRSPHGERQRFSSRWRRAWTISIHAPRTGSDGLKASTTTMHTNFNPRSPHGERRERAETGKPCKAFQSTLPARGATQHYSSMFSVNYNFNPRSPHGERLRKVTILSIRIIDFAQKVYHKTVLLRISLAENAVILPEKPRNPVRTSLQKAGGLRFARAIRAAHPYSISSPSGA